MFRTPRRTHSLSSAIRTFIDSSCSAPESNITQRHELAVQRTLAEPSRTHGLSEDRLTARIGEERSDGFLRRLMVAGRRMECTYSVLCTNYGPLWTTPVARCQNSIARKADSPLRATRSSVRKCGRYVVTKSLLERHTEARTVGRSSEYRFCGGKSCPFPSKITP